MYQIRNNRTGKPLNRDLQIHFIEIPKWDNLSRNAKNRLERWLEFISNKKPKEVEEFAMTDAAIKEALEAEKEFFSSEESRYLYDMRQKAIWTMSPGCTRHGRKVAPKSKWQTPEAFSKTTFPLTLSGNH